MKAIVTSVLIAVCILGVWSCDFRKSHKDVDSFYTTRNFGQFFLVPLIKPLALSYDPSIEKWGLSDQHALKEMMYIDSLTEIGVDKTYIYGKLFARKHTLQIYNPKHYVFVDKFGVITSGPTKDTIGMKDKMQIHPTDSIHQTFIIPERWFVINAADSTTEAFFSEAKYQTYLKEKGLSGRMYGIDSVGEEFTKTGIAPWFPDSIKIKLRQ
jgi:hypothetical protein